MPASLQETFRVNVRRRLRELGMSQRDLAKRLDVADPNISDLLNKDNSPTLKKVGKVAKALGTNSLYLLTPVETDETSEISPARA